MGRVYLLYMCALKLCTAGCKIDDFTSKLVFFCKLCGTPIARVTEGVLCVSVSGVPLQLFVVRLYHICFLDQLSMRETLSLRRDIHGWRYRSVPQQTEESQ